MGNKTGVYPSLYNPSDALADFYSVRTPEFAEEGRRSGLRPATRDQRRVALILVDYQYDFVHPTGSLYVPGSQQDVCRVIDFIYSNAEDITSIYASLDTHHSFQIFYPSWWQYEDNGERPNPFTVITLSKQGEMIDMVSGRRIRPLFDPKWSGKYVYDLKQGSKKDLVIWPYHCMEGSMGQALMPALHEALTFHSEARLNQIVWIPKGRCARTENYGIFAAEVPDPKDPSTGINTVVLDALATHDLVYVAGEAKSHCVLETENQLLNYFSKQPEIIRKLRFLRDCTSSVQHPAIDFESIAEARLAEMEKLGVQRVLSTDPIA